MSQHFDQIRQKVREGYSVIARKGIAFCCALPATCGRSNPRKLAKKLGYSDEDLAAVPESANLGLACGNAAVAAGLKAGEVVADLGCGSGFDAFLAGRRVGKNGRVIGVDMTPTMISLSRKNALQYQEASGLDNVEFRLAEIEHLPLGDESVDVIISNCVLHLTPDKPQAWRDMFRVLKPGGRVIISDLLLRKSLPPLVEEAALALIGGVIGVPTPDATRTLILAAGMTEPEFEEKPGAVSSIINCGSDLYQEFLAAVPGESIDDYVESFTIRTEKTKRAHPKKHRS